MKALLTLIIGLPIAIVVLTLALANTQIITITLDPFTPGQPLLALHAQLYVVVFVVFLAGIIIGGLGTWLGQGRFRRAARQNRREARRWRQQAETMKAAHDAALPPPGLPALPRP